MSYVQSHADPAARAKAVILVGGVHAVLAAGLLLGLTFTGVIQVTDNPDGITIIPKKEDVPPPPDEVAEPIDTYIPPTAPTPKVSVNDTISDRFLPIDDTPIDYQVVRDPTPLPTPSFASTPQPLPSPSFAPVAPVPRNASSWITNDDYPRISITRQQEGTASYRLVVGSNGRVDGCEITVSTGFAALDQATCRQLERRARFEAAKDQSGRTVVGTYSGQVTWQIPD